MRVTRLELDTGAGRLPAESDLSYIFNNSDIVCTQSAIERGGWVRAGSFLVSDGIEFNSYNAGRGIDAIEVSGIVLAHVLPSKSRTPKRFASACTKHFKGRRAIVLAAWDKYPQEYIEARRTADMASYGYARDCALVSDLSVMVGWWQLGVTQTGKTIMSYAVDA